MGERLCFQRLSGEGPETGWVPWFSNWLGVASNWPVRHLFFGEVEGLKVGAIPNESLRSTSENIIRPHEFNGGSG